MKVKALALISGGLDSTLAAKLIKDQGIEVEGVTIVTPFPNGEKNAVSAAEQLGIKHHIIFAGNDYLKIVRAPKYGYGTGMNPCIDCKIYFFKIAKRLMREIGASFIVSGEVVGQRPFSQRIYQLALIEKESGLEGLIVRPLSAQLLPPTIPERKGLIRREQLLAISGRSRRRQISMAKEMGLTFPTPAGGCILTDKAYARRLKDLFEHKKRVSLRDLPLLKIGRHFRIGKVKIIIGRNEAENEILSHYKQKLEVVGFAGPTTVIIGKPTQRVIKFAAAATARYSDAKRLEKVEVKFGNKKLFVRPAADAELGKLRI